MKSFLKSFFLLFLLSCSKNEDPKEQNDLDCSGYLIIILFIYLIIARSWSLWPSSLLYFICSLRTLSSVLSSHHLKKRKKESRQRKKEKKNPPPKRNFIKNLTCSNSLTIMTKVSRTESSYIYFNELKAFIYITEIQKSVQPSNISRLHIFKINKTSILLY